MKFKFEKLIDQANIDEYEINELLHTFDDFVHLGFLEEIHDISNIFQYIKWISNVLYQLGEECDEIKSIYNNLKISVVENTLDREFGKLILAIEDQSSNTISYIKLTGFQDSYNGTPAEFDREIEEVFPKQIMKTVYVNSSGEE